MTVKDWGLYVYLNVIQKTANYWGNFFYTENAKLQINKRSRHSRLEYGFKKIASLLGWHFNCLPTCLVFNRTAKCSSCFVDVNILVWIIWVLQRQGVEIRHQNNFSDIWTLFSKEVPLLGGGGGFVIVAVVARMYWTKKENKEWNQKDIHLKLTVWLCFSRYQLAALFSVCHYQGGS